MRFKLFERIKSEDLRLNVDNLTKVENTLLNSVFWDFNMLSILQLHSEKCSARDILKLDYQIKQGSKNPSIYSIIPKEINIKALEMSTS